MKNKIKMTKNTVLILLLILNIFSCKNEEVVTNGSSSKPNILLIIADDMGLDATPGYDVGDLKPNMPNLESLINSGLKFTNLWSYPTCTPTRSSILTGKYGFRTGVTKVGDQLSTSEVSLHSYLDNNTNLAYNHAVIGKWHLSNSADHPTNMGVGHYAGLLSGGVQSYWNWSFTVNSQTTTSNEYTTTKFTDLAIDWIGNQTEPWFLWLAYNAPHTPFHLPDQSLHTQGVLPTDEASIEANPIPYYLAMLEALDTEMGRLFNAMSQEDRDNTIIIFIGDNGTPNQVAQEYNSRRAKGTVFQGGVNVPMIISGKNVSRINDTENALINTTDLFATIADIAGVSVTEINDSKSFKSLFSASNPDFRNYTYTENGLDDGAGTDITIRNKTHKYIFFADGDEALYDLSDNPLENPNLLSPIQQPLSDADELVLNELKTKIEELKN